jgi:hypothetical protein
MIYILVGDDIKNKNIYIKNLIRECESFFVFSNDFNKNLIINYSSNINLFGATPAVILENIISEKGDIFLNKELDILKESKTLFLFIEDKMLAASQKKYKKYGEIITFENKKINQKFNTFAITDAFANKNKIATWTIYNESILQGIEPEAIAGLLFWKIKNMILTGSKIFNKNELKSQSSQIISIYHKAHKGELDFSTSLERFILITLSSK